MGWNGSPGNGTSAPRVSSSTRKPFPVRRLVVLAIVAIPVIIAVVYTISSSKASIETRQTQKASDPLKAVDPSLVAIPVKSLPQQAETEKPPKKMWYDADTNSAAYRVYHHKGPVITNTFARKTQSLSAQTFKYTSDKIIGQLLSVKLGDSLFGDVKYDERFTRRFLESLKTPIEISPEDSDQVVALKEAVIEARKELKAAYDRGEDVAKIMTDMRKELKELGAYRDELQKQVNSIIRRDLTKFSAQDLEDCINAANKMLSDRGCEPLRMPGLMRHRLNVLKFQQTQESR